MSEEKDPIPQNRAAWKQLTRQQHRLTRAAHDMDFADPLAKVDGLGWLGGDIRGKRVLCLASGGGRQGPLYAAAGAVVTVVDFCQELLDQDREVAESRGLYVETINTSMTDLSGLGQSIFDVVIHPVSTSYVSDILEVFRQVARVLKPGGTYISQHKQPASLQASLGPQTENGWLLVHKYRRSRALPEVVTDNLIREPGTQEFIHSWQSIIGGMCRAGFVIEDLIEPDHAKSSGPDDSFARRSKYVPPYVRIRARRVPDSQMEEKTVKEIWTPD